MFYSYVRIAILGLASAGRSETRTHSSDKIGELLQCHTRNDVRPWGLARCGAGEEDKGISTLLVEKLQGVVVA